MTAFGLFVMAVCGAILLSGSKAVERYTEDLSDRGMLILFTGISGAAVFLLGVIVKLWSVMP
jgi:hypothetical protein